MELEFQGAKMKKDLAVLLTAVLVVTLSAALFAQEEQSEPGRFGVSADGSGPMHTIYGDVKVEGDAAPDVAQTFVVTLEQGYGQIFARDSVPAGGRFRFNNVPNGEYNLIVEVEGAAVYRERFVLMLGRSSDFRKDVELIWSEKGFGGGALLYARPAGNQKLFSEGLGLAQKGDLKKAVSTMEKVVKADANDFEAWIELGNLHFKNKKYKDAEKAYTSAMSAKSDYLLAPLNLGKVRIAAKDYEGAIQALETAAKLDPKHAESQQLIGESYLQLKKGSKAVGYLNEAIRLDPVGMADVHLRLAQLYDAAGYKDLAAKEYSAFLQKRPDYPEKKKLEEYIQKQR